LAVAALAGAGFAVAALAGVAGFAGAAFAGAAFAVAALAAGVARGLRGGVGEAVDRVFPERGDGTLSGAFTSAVAPDERGFPWAGAEIRRVPLAGVDPSA
jgi:hypothetical protein